MKVAVLGYGTVGSGVVEVLLTNQASIAKKADMPIEVKYILDIRDFKDSPLKDKFVKDMNIILNDEEIKIVAEAMGGVEPAYSFVKEALLKGKSVVTSNKELVAAHGPELLEVAKQNDCNFLFEASVGGGIPIIRPLNSALTADEIYEITGILNGTTNFILTKMKTEGRAFEDVLQEAQALGYAERNPEADVEGHDACRKIAILASLALGEHVDYKDVYTQGITKIQKEDMDYAAQLGYSIKLLGSCKNTPDGIYASVQPTMILNNHPLATVDDVFNAVLVKGNMVGDVMFYGRGAGKLPTASAMVADIIDAAKHQSTNIMCFWSREKVALEAYEGCKVHYFVRLKGNALTHEQVVQEAFGKVECIAPLKADEYAFITECAPIQELEEKLSQLKDVEVISKIYIEK
ncbi:MAG: homoserine dehydrogenase [Niameybacter sp.]|uniref:homoserine dehydrogenase n=1 Tax=Niameybacter sp. TaxID=2033640 RepID=UPI002FC9C44E